MQRDVVAVDPAEFAGFDRGCAEFLRVIETIRALAGRIAEQEYWGLGEDDPRLISAAAVVARLRAKARHGGNSVDAVLAAHARVVAELRLALRRAFEEFALVDEEWADRQRSVDGAVTQRVSTEARDVRV
ncbi:hypothetical protein NN3_57130 [Nocardia neocaledoniensis NBRC 108232]|uniref:Uncharacterized protein n=1 Tax=Nocardia neocaledoniensis TaxID=236511 RepID=A0A317NCM1_9NOCA|nr:hypothetical protein [Nocardia neocaledoniensis]PWV72949.1 hypothetical protein DFR69_108263 [Nocardia neocaledoniensis]GEM34706.1 hypothetical protein NN3_57130 [Nocardia neocaledoniensis NBRC 108232]